MPAKITLFVTHGALTGRAFEFEERTSCLIGRHPECGLQLPADAAHKTISRHHALLDINPPQARIRDFGSLNGTFVNGQKIGARARHQSAEEGAEGQYPERDLHDGDEIRAGDTVFRVAIETDASDGLQASSEASFSGVSQMIEQLLAQAQASSDAPGSSSGPVSDAFKIKGYEIVEELGRGGMGAVYLARNRKSGETVALKVMLPRAKVSVKAKAAFEREVELCRALHHPNVVGLRDWGFDNDIFFFTLEYCEDGSLWDAFMAKGTQPSVGEAFAIMLQVLDGLEYISTVPLEVKLQDGTTALANGLVHRDLGPQNILLKMQNDTLVAKISDVGLGKAFDTAGMSGMTMTGDAAGKPTFMPRQQVVNFKFAKPEVDVWAAAATLYFLLSGSAPRDFPDGVDPWKVVLTTDPVPLRKRIPKCPQAIADVLDLALRDNPDLHYKRARDLQRDLIGAMKQSGLLS